MHNCIVENAFKLWSELENLLSPQISFDNDLIREINLNISINENINQLFRYWGRILSMFPAIAYQQMFQLTIAQRLTFRYEDSPFDYLKKWGSLGDIPEIRFLIKV